MTRDLLRGHPAEQIARQYQLTAAQVEHALPAIRRHVAVLARLADLHTPRDPATTAGRARALHCLLCGLPIAAVGLAYLDAPAERLIALAQDGCLTLSQKAQRFQYV